MQDRSQTPWSRAQVAEALLDAGCVALEHFRRPEVSMKQDMTLVTEADKEIEQHLIRRFARPEEGVYFIGEETVAEHDQDYVSRALDGRAFIVDPVDGTLPFAHGFPTWGISIGYAEGGFLKEGGLFLPTSGDLLITEGPDVYLGRLGPVPVDWDPDRMVPFTLPAELDVSLGVISVSQDVAKRGGVTGPEQVHANGSAVYSMAHLALSSLSGYIANLKLWDIAGGWPVLNRLGFSIAFADGSQINDKPISECFKLSADSSDRWRVKDRIFIGRTPEYVADLRRRTNLG